MARRSSKWYWLTVLVLLGLTAAYAQWRDLYPRYIEYTGNRVQIEQLRERVDAAKQEAAQLEEKVKEMDANPVEMEANIRQGKNLVRPGETVYRVEGTPDEAQP